MARKQMVSPPEEESEAPEFNLPGVQGGQLRLGLRTARGPVIVVFYRGVWSEECVEYFKSLAEKEREINVAGATVVGIGPVEPGEAREFALASGFKSYILYDYIRVTTREYGLLEKDAEHGDTVRPAVFLIGSDHKVLRAWLDERPSPDDLLAEVSRVTGLPKEPEEEEEGEEKPKKRPRKSAKSAEGESEAGDETAEGEASAGTQGEQKPAAEGGKKERAGKNDAPDASEPSKKAETKEGSGGTDGSSDAAPGGTETSEVREEGGADSKPAEGSESSREEAPARDEER